MAAERELPDGLVMTGSALSAVAWPAIAPGQRKMPAGQDAPAGIADYRR